MEKTTKKSLLKDIEMLKQGLIAFATSSTDNWENADYQEIRAKLLQFDDVKARLPDFIIKYRSLEEFWPFIKNKFAHYSERRQFIYDELSQVMDYLESGEETNLFSTHTKSKVIKWLSEKKKYDTVKLIDRCQISLTQTSKVTNYFFEYSPDYSPNDFYLLNIKAPSDIYTLLQDAESKENSSDITDAFNLILKPTGYIIETNILPLINDTIFHNESFSKISLTSSEAVTESWQKMLDRVQTDPEGAITSARTLVEDVCKYILDEYELEYIASDDISTLYKKSSNALGLAPENHSEQIYKQILGGCSSVVTGLGGLRNALSDAHGKGRKSPKPSPRHGMLAVNLAATMAVFLIQTYENRKLKQNG